MRTRKLRKDAAAVGKTFDDIAAEHEAQGIPFRFAERKRKEVSETVSDEEKNPTGSRSDENNTQVLEPLEEDACDTPTKMES